MKDLSGFIARAKECNTGLEELPTLTPFVVEGKEVGKLKPKWVLDRQRQRRRRGARSRCRPNLRPSRPALSALLPHYAAAHLMKP